WNSLVGATNQHEWTGRHDGHGLSARAVVTEAIGDEKNAFGHLRTGVVGGGGEGQRIVCPATTVEDPERWIEKPETAAADGLVRRTGDDNRRAQSRNNLESQVQAVGVRRRPFQWFPIHERSASG